MKKYMITSRLNETTEGWEAIYTVHENIGGAAYKAIWWGSKNELARWLKENNITDYGHGF